MSFKTGLDGSASKLKGAQDSSSQKTATFTPPICPQSRTKVLLLIQIVGRTNDDDLDHCCFQIWCWSWSMRSSSILLLNVPSLVVWIEIASKNVLIFHTTFLSANCDLGTCDDHQFSWSSAAVEKWFARNYQRYKRSPRIVVLRWPGPGVVMKITRIFFLSSTLENWTH